MRKSVIFLSTLLLTISLGSCNPEPILEVTHNDPIADCCGEQGQLPSEPGDDDEEDEN
ncbi:MAG: hypothetical protein AAF489_14260 [Bacteroidota bacterium]